jgi:hypothetical protein
VPAVVFIDLERAKEWLCLRVAALAIECGRVLVLGAKGREQGLAQLSVLVREAAAGCHRFFCISGDGVSSQRQHEKYSLQH